MPYNKFVPSTFQFKKAGCCRITKQSKDIHTSFLAKYIVNTTWEPVSNTAKQAGIATWLAMIVCYLCQICNMGRLTYLTVLVQCFTELSKRSASRLYVYMCSIKVTSSSVTFLISDVHQREKGMLCYLNTWKYSAGRCSLLFG